MEFVSAALDTAAPAEGASFLVRRREEWRQVAIVAVYLGLMAALYLVPSIWVRNPLVFVLCCLCSFLNAVVIHNHMHKGIFHSRLLNTLWRYVLSFGALYPASANIPAHNLVHHHFGDDGQPDWADPSHVRFRYNLLNLLHFPNIAGPNTFTGVARWAKFSKHPGFARQYNAEIGLAVAITALLLWRDFWPGLFFVVLPQLYGARCILRINLIQHDRTDPKSEFNHSRNFVGRAFNWVMCNNGYHTIHHNRAGLHWADLHLAHAKEVVPRMDPSLDERSMVGYLARTYFFALGRPPLRALTEGEARSEQLALPERTERWAEAEREAIREATG